MTPGVAMVYAIFTRRQRGKQRVMHAVREGEQRTVCELPIGRGTGLVRDGNYHDNTLCGRCWR